METTPSPRVSCFLVDILWTASESADLRDHFDFVARHCLSVLLLTFWPPFIAADESVGTQGTVEDVGRVKRRVPPSLYMPILSVA